MQQYKHSYMYIKWCSRGCFS